MGTSTRILPPVLSEGWAIALTPEEAVLGTGRWHYWRWIRLQRSISTPGINASFQSRRALDGDAVGWTRHQPAAHHMIFGCTAAGQSYCLDMRRPRSPWMVSDQTDTLPHKSHFRKGDNSHALP